MIVIDYTQTQVKFNNASLSLPLLEMELYFRGAMLRCTKSGGGSDIYRSDDIPCLFGPASTVLSSENAARGVLRACHWS